MTETDSYDLIEAMDALYEKTVDGYGIDLSYDPVNHTSWLKWTPPGKDASYNSGRGVRGSIFDRRVLIAMVRQFVLDAKRIREMQNLQDNYESD